MRHHEALLMDVWAGPLDSLVPMVAAILVATVGAGVLLVLVDEEIPARQALLLRADPRVARLDRQGSTPDSAGIT